MKIANEVIYLYPSFTETRPKAKKRTYAEKIALFAKYDAIHHEEPRPGAKLETRPVGTYYNNAKQAYKDGKLAEDIVKAIVAIFPSFTEERPRGRPKSV